MSGCLLGLALAALARAYTAHLLPSLNDEYYLHGQTTFSLTVYWEWKQDFLTFKHPDSDGSLPFRSWPYDNLETECEHRVSGTCVNNVCSDPRYFCDVYYSTSTPILNVANTDDHLCFSIVIDGDTYWVPYLPRATLGSTGETKALWTQPGSSADERNLFVSFELLQPGDYLIFTDNLGTNATLPFYTAISYAHDMTINIGHAPLTVALSESTVAATFAASPTLYYTVLSAYDILGTVASYDGTPVELFANFGQIAAMSDDFLVVSDPGANCPRLVDAYAHANAAYASCAEQCPVGSTCNAACVTLWDSMLDDAACADGYKTHNGVVAIYDLGDLVEGSKTLDDAFQVLYAKGMPNGGAFGAAVSISGADLFVSDVNENVYYYRFNGLKFVLVQEIRKYNAASDAWITQTTVNHFGRALAVSDGVAVIAADEYIFIFEKSDGKYFCGRVAAPTIASPERYTVDTDGVCVFVSTGAQVLVYQRTPYGWLTLDEAAALGIDDVGDTIPAADVMSIASVPGQLFVTDGESACYMYHRYSFSNLYNLFALYEDTAAMSIAISKTRFALAVGTALEVYAVDREGPVVQCLKFSGSGWISSGSLLFGDGSTDASLGCSHFFYGKELLSGTNFLPDVHNHLLLGCARSDGSLLFKVLAGRLYLPGITNTLDFSPPYEVGSQMVIAFTYDQALPDLERVRVCVHYRDFYEPVSYGDSGYEPRFEMTSFIVGESYMSALPYDFTSYLIYSPNRAVWSDPVNVVVFPEATPVGSGLLVRLGILNSHAMPILDCLAVRVSPVTNPHADETHGVGLSHCVQGEGVYDLLLPAAPSGKLQLQWWAHDGSDLHGPHPFNLTLSASGLGVELEAGAPADLLVSLYDQSGNVITDGNSLRKVELRDEFGNAAIFSTT